MVVDFSPLSSLFVYFRVEVHEFVLEEGDMFYSWWYHAVKTLTPSLSSSYHDHFIPLDQCFKIHSQVKQQLAFPKMPPISLLLQHVVHCM